MSEPGVVEVARLAAAEVPSLLDDLAAVLKEAVDEGAGMSFLPPFPHAEARAYWESLLPDLRDGSRILVGARLDGRLVGCAMLDRARVPNGRHRAEVQKVAVARALRGRGIARRLLEEVERVARAEALTLLVLDTGRGPAGAGALYESAGYTAAGEIPRYWAKLDGGLEATVIYYKWIGSPDRS